MVLGEKRTDRLFLLGSDIGNDDVLVRGESEGTLVDLGNLAHGGLEGLSGLVLHTTILDESREVAATVLSRLPAELIDVRGELECASGLELPTETLLNFGLEVVNAHAVNGVLDTRVLAATGGQVISCCDRERRAAGERLTSIGYRCHVEW